MSFVIGTIMGAFIGLALVHLAFKLGEYLVYKFDVPYYSAKGGIIIFFPMLLLLVTFLIFGAIYDR